MELIRINAANCCPGDFRQTNLEVHQIELASPAASCWPHIIQEVHHGILDIFVVF